MAWLCYRMPLLPHVSASVTARLCLCYRMPVFTACLSLPLACAFTACLCFYRMTVLLPHDRALPLYRMTVLYRSYRCTLPVPRIPSVYTPGYTAHSRYCTAGHGYTACWALKLTLPPWK